MEKKPCQEFKRESFSMFTELLETINIEIVKALCSINLEQVSSKQQEIVLEQEQQQEESPRPARQKNGASTKSVCIKATYQKLKGWKK